MRTGERTAEVLAPRKIPLSALLSQTLVAFTIEFDNEFERQMLEAGYPGERLSLLVWSDALQFVPANGVVLRELAVQAPISQDQLKHMLSCLERWGFIFFEPGSTGQPIRLRMQRRAGRMLRDGWGSARGIRAEWTVRPTAIGLKAQAIWPPLFRLIEERWRQRFGEGLIRELRESLGAIVNGTGVETPFATLLSKPLHAFASEFDREADAPLEMSANVLRVLDVNGVRVSDLPRLIGGSPEMTAIGWRLQNSGYIVVEPDPSASRGKIVCLTKPGVGAQHTYFCLADSIEKRWQSKFGQSEIQKLRGLLESILTLRDGDVPLISKGMRAPAGVTRAGQQAPALGRQDVGSAARQRMRDLVAQTEMFVRDPAGTLPHYPLWDMNRGFGP